MKYYIFGYGDKERLPVIKDLIDLLNDNNCANEYFSLKKIGLLKFLMLTRKLKSKDLIIVTDVQLVFVAIILNKIKKSKLIYWKFESHEKKFSIKNSLLDWSFYLERFLSKSVHVVYPNEERLDLDRNERYKKHVFYNQPYVNISSLSKHSVNVGKIKLVLYGNLQRHANMYLNEWIDVVKKNPNLSLTIVGSEMSGKSERIRFISKLPNNELRSMLVEEKFDFSIVGYRTVTQNYLYCAPNKLLESVFHGVPIIGHSKNPWIVRILDSYDCGISIDFDLLCELNLADLISSEKYLNMKMWETNPKRKFADAWSKLMAELKL